MKRTSIANRLYLMLTMIILVIISFSIVIITIGVQVKNSSDKVIHHDMPLALNSLAMLEELGDMNSNLLEYLLGEYEEKQEYYGNYDELFRFYNLIPKEGQLEPELMQIQRMVKVHNTESTRRVFDTYDPILERSANAKINQLIINVGNPLEQLLDQSKEEEIADVGSTKNIDEIINDDLPGVRFYLELVDEAGDMLADLDRFVLGDSNAKASFYKNALDFETYLAQLKPLEQKPEELIKVAEIERLFNQLKSTGSEVFINYAAVNRVSALNAVEELEHQVFNEAEAILDSLSSQSRHDVETSMTSLKTLSSNLMIIMLFASFIVISLIVFVLYYARRVVFNPIASISTAVSKLRSGERDFVISRQPHNDELSDVIEHLSQFQKELTELDTLREQEQLMADSLAIERDKAKDALNNLQETQGKLIASEKLASLGSLVAGVAHEVNTPIGVSVTMSTTLQSQFTQFIELIKSGTIKKSNLSKFEQESTESLALLINSLTSASNLISSFKQVAVDQTSAKRREFNVYTVIDEVLKTLHHQIKRTRINYSFNGPDNVIMDSFPGALGQVITNLFTNAVAHGFDGADEGNIDIAYHVEADQLILSFSDNGKGIPLENLRKVFDPFFTTKLGKGGSGLGLNIAHNIVSGLLGGDISVESNQGTTFSITLPLIAPKREGEND